MRIIAKRVISVNGSNFIVLKYSDGTLAIMTESEFYQNVPNESFSNSASSSISDNDINRLTQTEKEEPGCFEKVKGCFWGVITILILIAVIYYGFIK